MLSHMHLHLLASCSILLIILRCVVWLWYAIVSKWQESLLCTCTLVCTLFPFQRVRSPGTGYTAKDRPPFAVATCNTVSKWLKCDITIFLSPRKNYQGNVQLLPNHMANKPRQPRWKLVSYPSQLDWSQSQRGSSKQLVLVNLNQMEVNEWVIATQLWAINGVSRIGPLMVIFTQLHCKTFSYITSDNSSDQWTSLFSSQECSGARTWTFGHRCRLL